MKKELIKRGLCMLLVLSLMLPTGISGVFALEALLSEPAEVEYVIPGEGISSSGLASLAGQIPGSVNLALKPNFNDNPYGLVVNSRRAANGAPQRIVNGFEYAQNNTGASSDVVALSGGAEGTAANPSYVTISWPEPYVFTGTSVMWWISGQSTQQVWPQEVTIEYSTGELIPFPVQPASANAALADRHELLVWHKVDGVSGTVGVAHNGSAPGNVNADWRRNTMWNNYVFSEPVVARHIRLSIVVNKAGNANAGAGINLWEVYGYDDPEATELEVISESFFNDLVADVKLPAYGRAGSTVAWEVIAGDIEAVNSETGAIKRPAFGAPAATGKIEATAVGTTTRKRVFDFSVRPLPDKTAEKIVEDALAALNLGQLTDRTENFNFPAHSADGAVYSWTTNSPYIWNDGTVLRPPLGAGGQMGATVSVTAGFGGVSDTKSWAGISVPEFVDTTRKIISAERPTIYSPEGTAPKLPNYLRVTYSDNTTEMRKIHWSGSSTALQTEQAARRVGERYPFTGNVMGDTGSGFLVTADIIVVEADHPEYGLQVVPSNVPAASALPLSAVRIDNDPNGDQNRLTQNRAGYITYTINQEPTQHLFPFRQAYGLSTDGYRTHGGWNAKLRGAGPGHYLSALALAYNSQVTAAQRTSLVSRMELMTRELRQLQELTMNVPHPTENRKWEARDFFSNINLDGTSAGMTGDQRVMGMSLLLPDWISYAYARELTGNYTNTMTWAQLSAILGAPKTNEGPRTYGHGYLNAIPPQHLLGNECYAEYSDGGNGVWAPYYALHKVLAGLVEIYYALDGDNTIYNLVDYGPGTSPADTPSGLTSTGQAVADNALKIAEDMGLWISNRFEHRTRAGVRPAPGEPGHELPGWRDSNWIVFIGGEYGGINETLARLYKITGDERQLSAAEGFWNDGSFANTGFRPFMADLAMNRDSIRILHANQAIPSITGTLWTFRGNNDPKYWNVSENFWEYNVGRYTWATGNVKGNPGNIEQYVGAYNQASALMLHTGSNETCAGFNLMKLSKYLNEHNPDDAKYMDHVERVFIGQIIGSSVPGTTTSEGCYHYPVHLNTSKSRGAATNINTNCCSGTRAEIHVKYQDSMYYTSADDKTFYVGLYMPSTARWDAQDITIKQETVWPSERATFRFTPGDGTGAFEMKFRVPYWATKGFSITLNGEPINGGKFEPSSYVSTGVRAWSEGDVIVVEMPYEFWIDYLPGKPDGKWLGAVMYGPVLMAADGTNSAERITSYAQADLFIDSYMNIDNMGVTLTGRQTLGTTQSGVNAITRNVPTLRAIIGGVERPLRPHYFVSGNYTTYFYINVAGGSWYPEKAALLDDLSRGKALLDSGVYANASGRFLIGAVANGAGTYSSEYASLEDVLAASEAIKSAILRLVSVDPDVIAQLRAGLSVNLVRAKAFLPGDYTWDSFASLQEAVLYAEAAGLEASAGELIYADIVIHNAIGNLVLLKDLDRDALKDAIDSANTEENPINGGEKLHPLHEFTIYTRLSWKNFLVVLDEALDVFNNISKNYNQGEIDEAAGSLSAARNQLLTWDRADEREDLAAIIAEAKALDPKFYTSGEWEAIQGKVADAEERLIYSSLTFIEMYGFIAEMRALMAVPVTSLRIDASVTETVERGKSYRFGLRLNDGATGEGVVWTLSDPAFALVDLDGTVYILNKTGTVRLIATDPVSGLHHSITLRIAS